MLLRLLVAVVQTVLRQAVADAAAEDGKAGEASGGCPQAKKKALPKALRPKCPLVALFRSLDPMGKAPASLAAPQGCGGTIALLQQGYLLDTDFWQLVQDFRGACTFSSLCPTLMANMVCHRWRFTCASGTLVQEVQLRRRLVDWMG